jgi:hypothetical protein
MPVVVVAVPLSNCVGELLPVVADDIADADSGEKESIVGQRRAWYS